jgi:hypothetical protein
MLTSVMQKIHLVGLDFELSAPLFWRLGSFCPTLTLAIQGHSKVQGLFLKVLPKCQNVVDDADAIRCSGDQLFCCHHADHPSISATTELSAAVRSFLWDRESWCVDGGLGLRGLESQADRLTACPASPRGISSSECV